MAVTFRKVSVRLINDRKYRALSSDGKLFFLTVLLHPGLTPIGSMRASAATIASDLGWHVTRASDAMSDAMSLGMLDANEQACFMGLPNYLKHNPPQSPNSIVRAWIDSQDLVPECPEKDTYIKRAIDWVKNNTSESFKKALGKETLVRLKASMSDGIRDGIRDGIGDGIRDGIGDGIEDPCPIQKQKQKQKQNVCVSTQSRCTDAEKPGGVVTTHTQNPTPAMSRPTNRRDLDPEMLEITSYHAQLWALEGPQTPSGDDRFRIQQAILDHGLEACRHAVRGHYLDRKREETSKWSEVWWAFPAETIHGRRDTRKLSGGKFLALAMAGKPKSVAGVGYKKDTCQEEPESAYTPEEQKANIAKVKAFLDGVKS